MMREQHIKPKLSQARIMVIGAPPGINEQKVSPFVNTDSFTMKPIKQENRNFSSLASQLNPSELSTTKNFSSKDINRALKNATVKPTLSEIDSCESKPIKFIEQNQSVHRIKQWYNDLTPEKKRLLALAIIIAILACAIAVILPVLFLVILRSSSTTTTITTTTTISSTVISAYWTFDQTTADFYGVYNGSFVNGATYSASAANQPYIGNGRALSLSAASNQSYVISSPLINLNYTSFTIESWIYTTSVAGDRGIISQCSCSTCSNQCFFFILRSGRLYVDFMLNGLSGSTTIVVNTWYHVAFVYSYDTNQQILYVKGVQDAISSSVSPYQGTNASLQIGAGLSSLGIYYFNGYIDNVRLTTRAKSATEILFDATVTAYYSFDLSSGNNDNGPNGLNGVSTSTAVVTGRVNQAIRFSGLNSYFQAYGFYQFIYSMTNLPFSFSFWIYPTAVISSTIVQVTQLQSSGSCMNFIGITSPNGLTGQLAVLGYSWPYLYGPSLTVNTWTHASVTYSTTNGMRLYANGVLLGSTGAYLFGIQNYITWLQIGYNPQLSCSGMTNNPFQGSIDEVYVHSRELAQTDITALANP